MVDNRVEVVIVDRFRTLRITYVAREQIAPRLFFSPAYPLGALKGASTSLVLHCHQYASQRHFFGRELQATIKNSW